MALLFSSCWSWIPLLWRSGNDNDSFEHLPDDIVIDILSRLPAVSVVRSRRVCKRWHSLMSTTSFAELHAEKAKLTILLKHEEDCIYIEDEELKNKKRYPFVMRRRQVAAWWLPVCSCNGLLLFLQSSVLYIWNPITGEYVSPPLPQHPMLVSAFFFHPIKKEYTVLSYVTDHKVAWFEMLSLRTRSWRRLSGFVAEYPYFYAHSFAPPPVVCGAMHWVFCTRENRFGVQKTRSCSSFIMRLNLQSEELDTLPHPDGQSFLREQSFFLVEMEKRLSLCSSSFSGDSFDVWMLMDYEKWSWVRRYRISLKSNRPLHPSPRNIRLPGRRIGDIRIVNGDLLLYWYGNGGLYSCDLQTSKLRRIVVQGLEWEYGRIFEHDNDPWFFPLSPTNSLLEPHVNTIVSLQNLYGYKGEFDFPPIKWLPVSRMPLTGQREVDMVENFLYRAKKRFIDGYVLEETISVISFQE